MLRFFLGISLCFIVVTCLAQSHKQAPPDTIASCLGIDNCLRCFLFTPSGAYPNRLTKFGPSESCLVLLQSRQLVNHLLDTEINVYAQRDEMQSIDGIQSISTKLQQNYTGVNLGSSEPILSSHMYQHIQAEQSKDMSKRIASLESAINTSIIQLEESFRKTHENLPLSEADTRERLMIAANEIAAATVTVQESNTNIRSLPRQELPLRSTTEEPFIASGMTKEMLAQQIRNQIPAEHLRAKGRDLGGVLRQDGINDKGQFRSEHAKLKAAHTRGDISLENYIRMEAQINAASTLAESTEPKAKLIAQRLLADTQSERQVDEGKTNVREVTTVDSDDNLNIVTQDATQVVPDSNLGAFVASIYYRIEVAQLRTDYAIDISSIYQGIDADRRRDVAAIAQEMLRQAERAFQNGELNIADLLTEFSVGIADLATTWIPTLSVGRSMYELITGRDAFSNKELTNLELAGRMIDIVSVGIGSKIIKGWDSVNRISQRIKDLPRYEKIIASGKNYWDRMTKLGKNPFISIKDLTHIADRHLPGGIDIAKGNKFTTVFLDKVDPLELTVDATELIARKNNSIIKIESFSSKTTDFFFWNREGQEIIGYGFRDGKPARDLALMIKKDGSLENIFPWHPDNPFPLK